MNRVPARLALLALRRSGYPVTGSALRTWVYRGHIGRYPDGYDLAEIITYLDSRKYKQDTPDAD